MFAPLAGSLIRSPKRIYVYDAAVSAAAAFGLLVGAAPLAQVMGWPAAAGLFGAIGAFLVSWALFNYAIGTAARPARSSVLANMTGDGIWVLLSVGLFVTHRHELNLLGLVLLVGQALFVAVVFAAKLRGLRVLETE